MNKIFSFFLNSSLNEFTKQLFNKNLISSTDYRKAQRV